MKTPKGSALQFWSRQKATFPAKDRKIQQLYPFSTKNSGEISTEIANLEQFSESIERPFPDVGVAVASSSKFVHCLTGLACSFSDYSVVYSHGSN
jgi:hypothetical protein